MKYKIDLRRGTSQPDTNITIRMQNAEAVGTIEERARDSSPDAERVIVYHTFSDGADPVNSTVEVGGPAIIDEDFGVANPGVDPDQLFRIDDGWLRRTTFAEDANFDGGEALVRWSGDMTGVTRWELTFLVKFHSSDGNGFAAIYEQAVNPANSRFMFYIGCGVGPAGQAIAYFDGTTTLNAAFVPVEDQVYAVKLHANAAALILSVDGVQAASWARATTPLGPIGLDLFDPGSAGVVKVDEFKIVAIT